MAKQIRLLRSFPLTYPLLVKKFAPRIIRSAAEAEATKAVLDQMNRHMLRADQIDYFDLLVMLYRDWQRRLPPLTPGTHGELVIQLMVREKLTQEQMAEAAGVSQPIISNVTKDKRQLSKRSIAKVCEKWQLDPALFLGKRD